jgi:hypothetical protein
MRYPESSNGQVSRLHFHRPSNDSATQARLGKSKNVMRHLFKSRLEIWS